MNLLDEKSNVKVVTKPQYIHEVKDDIMAQGVVKNRLKAADKTGRSTEIVKILEMEDILEKEVKDLLLDLV